MSLGVKGLKIWPFDFNLLLRDLHKARSSRAFFLYWINRESSFINQLPSDSHPFVTILV